MTGVALNYAEFAEKRLELVRQLLPKARRVAVIADFQLYSPHDFARLEVAADFNECTEQAIAIVARILRGESPATIPIYEGTRYGFAVNLRTARAMGLTIPASIRIQATEVIE